MTTELQDTSSVFDRYEAIRDRLPVASGCGRNQAIGSLMDITDRVDVFVFDAFGVLNVGETPIPGAAERLDHLRAAGCQIRVLTNAASYDRAGAIAKFKRLGMTLHDDEIITSREAALTAAGPHHWGVIAAKGDALGDVPGTVTRLGDEVADYDAVDGVLFLSAADWNPARQAKLEAALIHRPRPVLIANADLVAPRDDGFSLEPGYFGHLIADRTQAVVSFYGKPFGDVFAMVSATLDGVTAERIAMCGDSLHTDILGARAAGWQSVLVTQDGLFAGADIAAFCARSGIHADWQLGRI
ncbi:HAD-IIA family hydrolase [Roseovarius pelagicus]|uniref:HAD hydrolase-like protein n=1 Tax=Roseovarius pelagicus TaxID=2980108 RepID=A0ABY6DDB9_9RHOB|nr:HAD hydrolase-like protein [Roseovarius pelagicus]UXX84149.1 HAD hydrolase-like protein [Roseovarius pelagicus]